MPAMVRGRNNRKISTASNFASLARGTGTCNCRDLLLFPVDCDTHNFFATFRVTFVMPQVCFKAITSHIEMHHVRTFFCVAS